ncbi:hypothetical protein FUA48_05850 [Flavobacterium alkalisoli]|uniref:Uncharacterized protein n=1 Tax=Flavobacterium alkalisoli TaxID=2602769 RepID=A0A5B9FQ70_9FLAO|nr:hypothetical protein [Flavobacterium alkalisoli]QEE49120.1 hypothetical protein FUA48_05850 [Flavobacterium alkalisoli]
MVRIVNYIKRHSEDGREFFSLELSGGIEMVLSQVSGQFYATSKKAYITSTFDEDTCRSLIGNELPGSVSKVECEPYEFTVRETGEIITLSHRYVYLPEEKKVPQSYENVHANVNAFSMNEQFSELQT